MVAKLFRKYFKNCKVRKPVTVSKKLFEQQVLDLKELQQITVSSRLKNNLDLLKSILGQNNDIIFRSFNLGFGKHTEAAIIYIEGMVDKTMLNIDIMKPLMLEDHTNINPSVKSLQETIVKSLLTVSNVQEDQTIDRIVKGILSGRVILMVDGLAAAFNIDICEYKKRQITQPESEVLIRGPREGFTESLSTNITLIRRRLKSPNLVFESFTIGRVTSTEISVVYIKGIASPDMLNELKNRLQRIDIDGVLESGYLEEFIEDNPYSPFPQMHHTERPDRVTAALLEGRIAVITHGTPFVLIIPVELTSFLTSPEDYYERYMLGTVILFLRYTAFALSLLLPALYIAVTTFHQEMIPSRLLIGISSYRQGVPFPTLLEALIMEFMFEALREAGTRLPRTVGQAVSIVGALVIGQSAVQAGIVSPLMVIIVAVTGIFSFMMPSYNLAITLRLLRFPLMLLAGSMGLFGVVTGVLIITIHLTSLRSFGMPYLSSLAPLHVQDLKDVLIRAPWWAMNNRPVEIAKLNSRRQTKNLKPSPLQENPEEDG